MFPGNWIFRYNCVIVSLEHICRSILVQLFVFLSSLRTFSEDLLSHGRENHIGLLFLPIRRWRCSFHERHACEALSSRAMCRRCNFWDRFCKGGHVQQPGSCAGPLMIFVLARVSRRESRALRVLNIRYLNSVYARSLLFSFRFFR